MKLAVSSYIGPNNLSAVIEAIGCGSIRYSVWNIERIHVTAGKYEAMASRGLVRIPISDNIAFRINAKGSGVTRCGILKVGEIAVCVNETVSLESVIYPHSDDSASIIDGIELSSNRAAERHVESRQLSLMEYETVFLTIAARIAADDVSMVVDSASKARMCPQNPKAIQRDIAALVAEKCVPAANNIVHADKLPLSI